MNLRRTITAFLILSTTTLLSAQTHATAPAATGTVEGRVFGITRGGDLKPARMPTIYLLYKGRGEPTEEKSADDHYSITSLTALDKRLKEQIASAEAGSVEDEELKCRESLLDTDQSLVDTAQWALDNKKARQVLMTDGDEEGYFKVAKVPVGHYRVVARGQAGANDAYWESFIVVKTGMTTSTKLTSPGRSCLRVE